MALSVTLIFSLFSLFGFCQSTGECEDRWIPFREHCYFFSSDKLSWYDAKEYCNRRKGYLARVETPKESTWLKMQARIISREYTWIGGTDLGHEGVWKWESDVEVLKYTDFLKGQPNNHGGNEHCLEMFSTGVNGAYTWNDLNCSNQRKFVCEKAVDKDHLVNGGHCFKRGRHVTVINNHTGK